MRGGRVGLELLHQKERGEEVADPLAPLRVIARVLPDRDRLAPPAALEKLFRELLDRVAVQARTDHRIVVGHDYGTSVSAAFNRSKARM